MPRWRRARRAALSDLDRYRWGLRVSTLALSADACVIHANARALSDEMQAGCRWAQPQPDRGRNDLRADRKPRIDGEHALIAGRPAGLYRTLVVST